MFLYCYFKIFSCLSLFLCSCIVISKYSRVCPCSCVCQFLGKKCSGCSLESLVEGRGALEIREARGLKQHYLVLGNGKWTIILLSGTVSNDTLLQGSLYYCSCVKVCLMWSSLLKQHLPQSSRNFLIFCALEAMSSIV